MDLLTDSKALSHPLACPNSYPITKMTATGLSCDRSHRKLGRAGAALSSIFWIPKSDPDGSDRGS